MDFGTAFFTPCPANRFDTASATEVLTLSATSSICTAPHVAYPWRSRRSRRLWRFVTVGAVFFAPSSVPFSNDSLQIAVSVRSSPIFETVGAVFFWALWYSFSQQFSATCRVRAIISHFWNCRCRIFWARHVDGLCLGVVA